MERNGGLCLYMKNKPERSESLLSRNSPGGSGQNSGPGSPAYQHPSSPLEGITVRGLFMPFIGLILTPTKLCIPQLPHRDLLS
jgi:hypothetical protein